MSSAGLRFLCKRTVSGNPLATRFLAIPWPISPRPTKPIRGLSVLMIILSGNAFGSPVRGQAPTANEKAPCSSPIRRQFFSVLSLGNRLHSTSVDRRRLRGRQAGPPAFVPCQHHSAAGNGDDSGERPRVRKRPEHQPSCQR